MNQARNGEQMRMNFSHPCPPPVRGEVERGYREGYTAGVGGAPLRLTGPGGPVVGAGQPGWHCERAYGKEACGFRCVKAYGEIACAKEAHHNCVEAYGKVACGPNCRPEHGEIVCDW